MDALLTKITPTNARGQYACMDLGGELDHNPAVCTLLAKHHYKLCPTAPYSSSQNSLAKQAMLTIGNGICTLLQGAHLE